MAFDISVAMTWLLFLAMFPIAFYWLRRAWRIIVRRDFSEVALKDGEPPPRPERFAPYSATVNLIGGGIMASMILGVVFFGLAYGVWSAVAGSTIWMKLIFDFIIRRHAHDPIIKPSTTGSKERK